MKLIEASGIAKQYPGVKALRDARFELLSGEVHALVGENGAGKSTLIKVFTGAVEPDAGRVVVSGADTGQLTPASAKALGIAAIYQQPSLFPHLSVAENIALALEERSWFGRVNWGARRKRAKELLDRIGARVDPDQSAGELSMPQQQLVEIAKALGSAAKVFIMDEPTASLTDQETEHLFRVIGELKAGGAGIIYISHRLEELPKIADRVTVLRDGEWIGTHAMKDLDRDGLVKLMVGREVTAVFPKRAVKIGGVVMRVAGLRCGARGLHDISFELRAGEILGLSGLVGSGRTELAETLFGLTPADGGEISVGGARARIDSPAAAIALGIGYAPEDRRRHGLVQAMSVAENTTLARLGDVSRNGLLRFDEERAVAARLASQLGTKTPDVSAAAETLSGGNQQKVVLSRWLAIQPKVLILDEPTQGIDVGAKSEIHKLMCDLAEKGMAILMISSELPEILGMSDRIAVMADGTITAVLERSEATQERLLSLALPNRRKDAA